MTMNRPDGARTISGGRGSRSNDPRRGPMHQVGTGAVSNAEADIGRLLELGLGHVAVEHVPCPTGPLQCLILHTDVGERQNRIAQRRPID